MNGWADGLMDGLMEKWRLVFGLVWVFLFLKTFAGWVT